MLTLIEKTWQSRNDFDGIFECDKCKKHTFIKNGYGDENYFRRIVPTLKCSWCEGGSAQKAEQVEVIVKKWRASDA